MDMQQPIYADDQIEVVLWASRAGWGKSRPLTEDEYWISVEALGAVKTCPTDPQALATLTALGVKKHDLRKRS